MQCRGVSVSHINATRSAFVSVFKVYHQVVGNIASYPLIQDIFKAARRKQEKLPDPSADICEIETLVMRVTSWGKNEELSLTRLQQKTMVLLAVASMWRIRSDIGRLHWQDVCLQERIDGTYEGLTLLVRTPKRMSSEGVEDGSIERCYDLPSAHRSHLYATTQGLENGDGWWSHFFLGIHWKQQLGQGPLDPLLPPVGWSSLWSKQRSMSKIIQHIPFELLQPPRQPILDDLPKAEWQFTFVDRLVSLLQRAWTSMGLQWTWIWRIPVAKIQCSSHHHHHDAR